MSAPYGFQADSFEAVVVVSPAVDEGEIKNQDRAAWFGAVNVATLADGVSQSPFADRAAELVVQASPALFGGDIQERLRGLCDLLVANRLDALRSPIPGLCSSARSPLLQEVARERLKCSFQTTFLAVWFTRSDRYVHVQLLHCGDSLFFAFSPEGELLFTTHAGDALAEPQAEAAMMTFGPGDELLVKVLATAAERPELAGTAGIHPRHGGHWYVCRPLDRQRATPGRLVGRHRRDRQASQGTLLLIPRFLIGTPVDRDGDPYRRVLFSEVIRTVNPGSTPASATALDQKGLSTAALPDHFYTGNWNYRRERFPPETQFLLASDGFYTAFDRVELMWAWLRVNRPLLTSAADREEALQGVHARLRAKAGDDDVSFVWVRLKDGTCGVTSSVTPPLE